jgi:large subunit ribosomal protein L1
MAKAVVKNTIKKGAEKDTNLYSIEEAVKKAKEGSKVKFDATVELHINLSVDSKKEQVTIRFTTVLPNGTGKTKRVAVLASKKVPNADLELMESDIEKIEKGSLRPKVDFDAFISEPRFMAKLAKAARILGPAGMMPNPKLGTVTENVEEAVAQMKKGKIEIKTEKDILVIHTILGKVSFEDKALVENFNEIYSTLKQNKPAKAKPGWIKSIYIATSMGPSYAVNVVSLK